MEASVSIAFGAGCASLACGGRRGAGEEGSPLALALPRRASSPSYLLAERIDLDENLLTLGHGNG